MDLEPRKPTHQIRIISTLSDKERTDSKTFSVSTTMSVNELLKIVKSNRELIMNQLKDDIQIDFQNIKSKYTHRIIIIKKPELKSVSYTLFCPSKSSKDIEKVLKKIFWGK